MRRANGNYILKLSDGTIYHAIGGGVASDGTSMNVSLQAGYDLNLMIHYEEQVISKLSLIVDRLKAKLPVGDYALDLEFVGWDNDINKPTIREKKTNIDIRIYELS